MDLLLGCGTGRGRLFHTDRNEWKDLTTVDIDKNVCPDLEWDLNNLPLPFQDNSVDEIHAYNVLEHVGAQGDFRFFFAQFEDFYRILKPGGFICACVPETGNVWTWGDPGHTRVINNGTLTFLDQSCYKELGKTARTDYRWLYKGNLSLAFNKTDGDTFYFILRAEK